MKRYTAFISSTYADLVRERSEVIDALMDSNIIPVCMEHFTASSSESFHKLEKLIDTSDLFILILGDRYGTCGDDGISITEKEFRYARKNHSLYFVLRTKSHRDLLRRSDDGEELTEDEQKMVKFGESITDLCQDISTRMPISKIIAQLVGSTDFDQLKGWYRETKEDLEKWERANTRYRLEGTWYHVHLKQQDKSYLRVGTVEIKQNFNRNEYRHLFFEGQNYSVQDVDHESHCLTYNYVQNTTWSGEYFLKNDRTIMGLYKTVRYFDGMFCDKNVGEGAYSGLHEFRVKSLDLNRDGKPDGSYFIAGSFHDIFPTPTKTGQIFMFRTPEERYEFLMKFYKDILEGAQK